ncbi:unnamed protein product, partial [marine sediment metagenome]
KDALLEAVLGRDFDEVKARRCYEDASGFWLKVEEVAKKEYKGVVYDIQAPDQSFLSNFLVHNCMLKEDALYSLTGASATIYKLKTFAEIHGIVWKKTETKTPNVWNYDYALSFTAQDKIEPKFVVEVKGKEFTNVGRSLNTAVNVPIGGIITIRFHTINLYTDAKTGLKHIGVYEPRFYEYRKGDTSPDSFSSAVKIGRDSGLLIEKAMFVGIEFLKKGEALLVDEEFDVVEIAKEDAEFLSEIENTNFRVVKNEKRFLLKQDPYLHLPPENK